MITKYLQRLHGIAITGFVLLVTVLSGCDDDTVNGFLQFSDDNLLLKAAGDTAVIDVTAGSGWEAESMADWCTAEEGQGEWTGEELEIIFEGEEEDASEIFGKYIVTSEGGDSMTYYKRGFQ